MPGVRIHLHGEVGHAGAGEDGRKRCCSVPFVDVAVECAEERQRRSAHDREDRNRIVGYEPPVTLRRCGRKRKLQMRRQKRR